MFLLAAAIFVLALAGILFLAIRKPRTRPVRIIGLILLSLAAAAALGYMLLTLIFLAAI